MVEIEGERNKRKRGKEVRREGAKEERKEEEKAKEWMNNGHKKSSREMRNLEWRERCR